MGWHSVSTFQIGSSRSYHGKQHTWRRLDYTDICISIVRARRWIVHRIAGTATTTSRVDSGVVVIMILSICRAGHLGIMGVGIDKLFEQRYGLLVVVGSSNSMQTGIPGHTDSRTHVIRVESTFRLDVFGFDLSVLSCL